METQLSLELECERARPVTPDYFTNSVWGPANPERWECGHRFTYRVFKGEWSLEDTACTVISNRAGVILTDTGLALQYNIHDC